MVDRPRGDPGQRGRIAPAGAVLRHRTVVAATKIWHASPRSGCRACDDDDVLDRLSIQQLRCFTDLQLRFNRPEKGGDGWTVLVGENGTGKTTILQSIVLASMDPRPVTSLVETPWTWVRSGLADNEEGRIELQSRSRGQRVRRSLRRLSPKQDRYIEGASSPELPLLLAFSARRRIAQPGELPKTENLELERVRGLFATDHPLLTQDFFAALETKSARNALSRVLRDMLVYEKDGEHLFPLVDFFELRGKGGVTTISQLMEQRRFQLRYGTGFSVRVGVEDLSDGYQAMLVVVLEVLAQSVIATRTVPDPETLEAIVLIDEIEAHLHPRWQRTVVPLLRSALPRCQFIITTHSPLVVASAHSGEVHVLEVTDDGSVRPTLLEERLAMRGADEIYEDVFGVPRVAPPRLAEEERELLHRLTVEKPSNGADAEAVEAAWRDAFESASRR